MVDPRWRRRMRDSTGDTECGSSDSTDTECVAIASGSRFEYAGLRQLRVFVRIVEDYM